MFRPVAFRDLRFRGSGFRGPRSMANMMSFGGRRSWRRAAPLLSGFSCTHACWSFGVYRGRNNYQYCTILGVPYDNLSIMGAPKPILIIKAPILNLYSRPYSNLDRTLFKNPLKELYPNY